MGTPQQAFFNGLKTIAPVFVGALPFGLIAGITAVQSITYSAAVFAGTLQLAALQLMNTGAAVGMVALWTIQWVMG